MKINSSIIGQSKWQKTQTVEINIFLNSTKTQFNSNNANYCDDDINQHTRSACCGQWAECYMCTAQLANTPKSLINEHSYLNEITKTQVGTLIGNCMEVY